MAFSLITMILNIMLLLIAAGMANELNTDLTVSCFTSCYGVPYATIESFIPHFCSDLSANATLPKLWITDFEYPPQPGTAEQGLIELRVEVGYDNCAEGVFPSDWQQCVDALHRPLQLCDEGSDAKHGGVVGDSCVTWTVQPNPNGC